MHFYEIFVRLCNGVGKKPGAVAEEVGLSRATASRWGRGMVPTYANLVKLADYFGISVAELTGATPETVQNIAHFYGVSADLLMQSAPAGESKREKDNDELAEYLEDLRERPETRALLAATRGMTKEQVDIMANFAKTIRGDGD